MMHNDTRYEGVRGTEYWAEKGPISLFMWRKRDVAAIDPALPPVLLVHGSSMSALPTFDLTVPGRPDHSFMDWLAAHGHDVWTLDHEGYGRSTITEGNSDIACGIADIGAAVEVIRRETGVEAIHLYGTSSGALRAAGFAQAAPEKVSRLVLDAFVWTGEGSPTLAKRREGLDFFRAHNRRPIDRAFIRGIFSRDMPGTTEPDVIDACADAQLRFGDSVPTGTYVDMTSRLPLVDPDRILASTLIVRGEHDGISTLDDLLAFFRGLPTGDKRIAVLPGLAHCTGLGVRRHLLWDAVHDFLRAGRRR